MRALDVVVEDLAPGVEGVQAALGDVALDRSDAQGALFGPGVERHEQPCGDDECCRDDGCAEGEDVEASEAGEADGEQDGRSDGGEGHEGHPAEPGEAAQR